MQKDIQELIPKAHRDLVEAVPKVVSGSAVLGDLFLGGFAGLLDRPVTKPIIPGVFAFLLVIQRIWVWRSDKEFDQRVTEQTSRSLTWGTGDEDLKKSMSQYLKSLLGPALCVIALPACGINYDSEQIEVPRGGMIQTHNNSAFTLEKVSKESITIRSFGKDLRYNWELSTAGRFGKGEPFNLGNNESLQILSVDPVSESAKLQLIWLDSVGFLTMPPF